MGQAIDITNERFGKLVARTVTRNTKGQRAWVCQCDCGGVAVVIARELRSGNTRSCGCAAGRRTHGRHGTRTYHIWVGMRQRCSNPKATSYNRYGGAGVKVCTRWDSFTNFLLDMGEAPPGLTIERKDNARGYEPDNCVWATRAEQSRNRRCCHALVG